MTDEQRFRLDSFNALVEAHVKLADMQVNYAKGMAQAAALQIAACSDAVRLGMLHKAAAAHQHEAQRAMRERVLVERRQRMLMHAAQSAAALLSGIMAPLDKTMRWREFWRLVQLTGGECRAKIAAIRIGGKSDTSAWQHFRMREQVPMVGTLEWEALAAICDCLAADASEKVAQLDGKIVKAQARLEALEKQRWDEVDVIGASGNS